MAQERLFPECVGDSTPDLAPLPGSCAVEKASRPRGAYGARSGPWNNIQVVRAAEPMDQDQRQQLGRLLRRLLLQQIQNETTPQPGPVETKQRSE